MASKKKKKPRKKKLTKAEALYEVEIKYSLPARRKIFIEAWKRPESRILLEAQLLDSNHWPAFHDADKLYSGIKGAEGRQNARGAIALESSRLRHMGDISKQAMSMMKRAARKGEDALDEVIAGIAQYLDIPIREVYTFWFSP